MTAGPTSASSSVSFPNGSLSPLKSYPLMPNPSAIVLNSGLKINSEAI